MSSDWFVPKEVEQEKQTREKRLVSTAALTRILESANIYEERFAKKSLYASSDRDWETITTH